MSETGNVAGQTEMSYGQKAVGLTFNPGNNPHVDEVKRQYAQIIDYLYSQKLIANAEGARLYSIAITEAQAAQMWAVKAITWQF